MNLLGITWTAGKPKAIVPGMLLKYPEGPIVLAGGRVGESRECFSDVVAYATLIETHNLEWIDHMSERNSHGSN